MALQVKYLALYHYKEERFKYGFEDHEWFICQIISKFSNVETITLVNTRHWVSLETDQHKTLKFMDPVDLLV